MPYARRYKPLCLDYKLTVVKMPKVPDRYMYRVYHQYIFKSMYPGTWNFVSSSNPCTRVHGLLFFLQIHVPGYMNLRKQILGHFEKNGVALELVSTLTLGGMAPKKISFLFRFLPTLNKNLIF